MVFYVCVCVYIYIYIYSNSEFTSVGKVAFSHGNLLYIDRSYCNMFQLMYKWPMLVYLHHNSMSHLKLLQLYPAIIIS
jgi:hypothetical protein